MNVIRMLVVVALGVLLATRVAAQEPLPDQPADESVAVLDQDDTVSAEDEDLVVDATPLPTLAAPTAIPLDLSNSPVVPTVAREVVTALPTDMPVSTATATTTVTSSPTSATATSSPTPHATLTPTRSPTPTLRFTTGGVDIGTPIPNLGSPISPFDGTWTGTTSQGKPISLTIDSSSVKAVSFGWTTAGCGPVDGQMSASYSSNAPRIEGSRFSLMDMSPAGKPGLMMVTGGFSSPTSAGGQVIVTIIGSLDANGSACGSSADISWTATVGGH